MCVLELHHVLLVLVVRELMVVDRVFELGGTLLEGGLVWVGLWDIRDAADEVEAFECEVLCN